MTPAEREQIERAIERYKETLRRPRAYKLDAAEVSALAAHVDRLQALLRKK